MVNGAAPTRAAHPSPHSNEAVICVSISTVIRNIYSVDMRDVHSPDMVGFLVRKTVLAMRRDTILVLSASGRDVDVCLAGWTTCGIICGEFIVVGLAVERGLVPTFSGSLLLFYFLWFLCFGSVYDTHGIAGMVTLANWKMVRLVFEKESKKAMGITSGNEHGAYRFGAIFCEV